MLFGYFTYFSNFAAETEEIIIMMIRDARWKETREIAKLIMVTMNYECCQFWARGEHALLEFLYVMTRLVEHEASQYSDG